MVSSSNLNRGGAYLLSLARRGCRISIVYGAPSVPIATRLREAARRRLIDLWDSRWDHNNDGYNEIRTHAKYNIALRSAYFDYLRNWNDIRNHSRRLPYHW